MKTLITVFGGSRCAPDSAEYRDAVKLGRLLAGHGFTVVCGGYGGVIEAVSRGARAAGGEVLGITLAQKAASPNEHLSRAHPAPDLYERLRGLIQQSTGYIALRGGMGTVAEVAVVWNKFLLNALSPRPLVLLGDCWPPVIAALQKHLPVEERDVKWLQFAATPEEAVRCVMES
ncbi:MAG: LOG family protein [Verrucomicrobia bacterium]|nr:LOG family protein [Verrucomicrobiota bacterium]